MYRDWRPSAFITPATPSIHLSEQVRPSNVLAAHVKSGRTVCSMETIDRLAEAQTLKERDWLEFKKGKEGHGLKPQFEGLEVLAEMWGTEVADPLLVATPSARQVLCRLRRPAFGPLAKIQS